MFYYKGNKPHAPNIIDTFLRRLPKCGHCGVAATKRVTGMIIIGDPPLRCDNCSPPHGMGTEDDFDAELVRACEDYLSKNAVF